MAKDTTNSPSSPGSNRGRTFFNGLAIGVLIAVAVAWVIARQTKNNPAAQERFEQATGKATDAAGDALYEASQALKAKMDSLDLKPDQVREELAQTGKVVRRRAREIVGQVMDATSDAQVTAAIKLKLAADSELSVWNISVATTGGRVNLDGSVATEALVAKSVALAMDVDGVVDVTSNLKVQPQP